MEQGFAGVFSRSPQDWPWVERFTVTCLSETGLSPAAFPLQSLSGKQSLSGQAQGKSCVGKGRAEYGARGWPAGSRAPGRWEGGPGPAAAAARPRWPVGIQDRAGLGGRC